MLESDIGGPFGRDAAQYVALRDRIEATRMPLDPSPRGDCLVVCALARLQGHDDAAAGRPDYGRFLDVAEAELSSSCRSAAASGSVSALFAAVRSAYDDGRRSAA